MYGAGERTLTMLPPTAALAAPHAYVPHEKPGNQNTTETYNYETEVVDVHQNRVQSRTSDVVPVAKPMMSLVSTSSLN